MILQSLLSFSLTVYFVHNLDLELMVNTNSCIKKYSFSTVSDIVLGTRLH